MLKPFFVWQDRVLKKINPESVICLVTTKNYTKIYLSDKSICMVRSTLASALDKLPKGMFIKTHRAHAVSINFMDNIARDHLIVHEELDPVPIAKQYYRSVIKQLNIID